MWALMARSSLHPGSSSASFSSGHSRGWTGGRSPVKGYLPLWTWDQTELIWA